MSKHVETLMVLSGYALPETSNKLRKAAFRLEAAEGQLDLARKVLRKIEKSGCSNRDNHCVAACRALVEMTTINRRGASRK